MRIRKPSSKLAMKNHHEPAVNKKFGKKNKNKK
jgi:hypothetical protein